MGRKKVDAGVKIGHALTPAAHLLLQMLGTQAGADEAAILEQGIRLVFDRLPSSQRDAMSVLLRGKGLSLRDLRRIDTTPENALGEQAGEGQGTNAPTVAIRGVTDRIDAIGRRATAPVDSALAEFSNNQS